MKRILALCLTLVLSAVAVCPASAVGYASRPHVSEASEALFYDGFKTVYPKATCVSLAEAYETFGEGVGQRYANAINYYGDTGDVEAFTAVRGMLDGHDVSGYDFIDVYTLGSASSKVEVTESPFPDVPVDAWYAEAVTAMKDSGIIMGCDDGLFHPEREVTEGEFYAMLLRAATFDGANITGGHSGAGNHWASDILYTADSVFLRPPKGGKCETDLTTRGEAITRVTLLHEYSLEDGDKTYAANWNWTMARERTEGNVDLSALPDYTEIERFIKMTREDPDYTFPAAKMRLEYAYNTGICKGTDAAGTLNPYGTLTRAELAQMFYNAKLTWRVNTLGKTSWPGVYDFRSKDNFVA